MNQPVRVVEASGSGRDLGRAHGEALRPLIDEGIARWFEVIGRQTGMRAADYVSSFLGATSFTSAADVFAPSLLDEVRGIADGARQPQDVVLAYQMMDEEWAHRVSVMRRSRRALEACTAVGFARRDSTSVIGQNMDLPSHYDGTQAVLRLRPRGRPAVMVFTPAGLIGTTGLNERGVGVCVNALFELRHASQGLPVGFVLRAALASNSPADAVRLVRTVPHATGQNYLVGGPGGVVDLEASPGAVVEVQADSGLLAHTNHVLASDDVDAEVEPDSGSSTVERLASVRASLSSGDPAGVADVQRALSDRTVPVSVPRGSEWMTLGCVVMELTRAPRLHVAPGPPAETPFTELSFSAAGT